MKILVIGQGYVGLPLAIEAASAGFDVIGYDKNQSLINDLKQGKTDIPGIKSKTLIRLLDKSKYIPTADPTNIGHAEIIIIAVPTPLGEERNPDLKYVEAASMEIATFAREGTLIINESTSYPGTLRNYIKEIIFKKTAFNFEFAAAPERVDPTNKKWSIKNTPRIVSGITDKATELAIEFYSNICQQVIRVSSPEVAEASKLFENTFRQVNIALVNEFSEIAKALNFSSHEAILAAASKPFGFMPFFPSIGVGGHCIPVDPTYLSFRAKELGVETKFIDLANKSNLSRALSIVNMIQREYNSNLYGRHIQLAGIAYKANLADIRESPAISLIYELKKIGAKVTWCDPLVKCFNGEKTVPLDPKVDLGLIISPHDEIDFSVWRSSGVKVFDLSPNSTNYGWPKFF